MVHRLTGEARRALATAQRHADALGDDVVRPGHLLLAVADDTGGVPWAVLGGLGITRETLAAAVAGDDRPDPHLLSSLGIDLDAVRRHAEDAFGPGALEPRRTRRRVAGTARLADGSRSALVRALHSARAMGDPRIGTAHLLLGLLDDPTVAGHLTRAGADPATVRDRVVAALRPAA